jgi:hypothetical protein
LPMLAQLTVLAHAGHVIARPRIVRSVPRLWSGGAGLTFGKGTQYATYRAV